MQITGHSSVKEPFEGLFTQGMVVHETYRAADGVKLLPTEVEFVSDAEGRRAFRKSDTTPVEIGAIQKMSKSLKNLVDPDDIIDTYGADTARLFMLSDSPPDRDVIWSEDGVQGAARYVQQLWRLIGELAAASAPAGALPPPDEASPEARAIRKASHQHLLKVEDAVERLRFNTAIAEIRKLSNTVSAALGAITAAPLGADMAFALREAAEFLTHMFAPMMPHLAEACWARLGHAIPVSESSWPQGDASLSAEDMVSIPVQVNGKKRADLAIAAGASAAEIEAAALTHEAIVRSLAGQQPRKVIVVGQRIVNVVV